ncbi:lipocalin-like domain-containing protein [Aquamicrobium sp.]|uniref:lipocalin-like domain-containing protein n=1 Tax=Aquamicrobium sp. TaxID=1872579 RepID=UPI0025860E22|nr:lipocalin-like domain-containing protein [Aquamicrobium sp.]MCK9550859.1 lipocalin-like domain-containing protein [Aquamicrobium sp.]
MEAKDIEGRWAVLSWRQEYDDGRVLLPMGKNLAGFAEYRNGRVTIMVVNADRPRFATGGQWDASPAEKAGAYETGLFYAGRYRVEGETVFHEIEIASFQNWVGGTQMRRACLEGDRLQLIARLEDGGAEARTAILEWRREG